MHGNCLFRIFSASEFLLLRSHEHRIGNNGLMGVSVEIPIHEAIVFNLRNAGADGLLKQYPSGIFFIREQLVDCFPVPLGLTCWGWDTLPFQT